ncbi:MAG: phosphatase PAP2 family protein [Vulcanimicrobiota bacterium]
MESSTRPVRADWSVDGLVVGYLTLTALLSFLVPERGLLPWVHFGTIGVILAIRRWGSPLLCKLYSVPLVPCLYLELDVLSRLAGGQTYDQNVLRWEIALFGDPIPAVWFSEALPHLLVSELLHLCYLSYYPLLLFLAWRMYRTQNPHLATYLFCSHAATFTIYLIQIWFPVYGPRPLLPPLDESLQGPMWWLCHFLCGQGASGAAAFPSGHVTFACAAAVAAWRWDPRAYRWLLPVCCGMALSTIYGRFHYGVDVLVGAAIGWFFVEFGPGFRGDTTEKANLAGPGVTIDSD